MPRPATPRPAPVEKEVAPQIIGTGPPCPKKINKIRGVQWGKVDYSVDSDNEELMPFNFTLRRNDLI